jgi:predicted nucleotidyltransferase
MSITKTEIIRIIKLHNKELKEKFKVKEVGLFGSYVREEQKEKSDVDVLVEFDEPVSLLWLVKVENYLSEILDKKVDLIPKRDVRPELKEQILKEAVYL